MSRIFATTPFMTIFKDSSEDDSWSFKTSLKNEIEVRDHLNQVFDFKGAMSFGKITMHSHDLSVNYGYVQIKLAFELEEKVTE